jgi:O-antigen/teichoic acid export membrane protein
MMETIGLALPRSNGLRVWARRGSWAFVDQVLFAGCTFAVNVLLARRLTASEYGAFAVAFLVFMLAGTIHTAALTEPMLVYGSGKYRAAFGSYLRTLMLGHALVAGAIFAAILPAAAGCWLLGAHTLALTFGALAAASPFALLVWLLRRAFYVQMRPQCAAIGDGIFLALTLGGLLTLARAGSLGAATAFLVMGAAGLVASLVLLYLLHAPRTEPVSTRAVVRDHWGYGRWNALEQGLYWSSAQSLMVLVPIVLGLPKAAVIGAILNLFRPLHPAMQSATGLMLPALAARASSGETRHHFGRTLRTLVLPYAAVIAGYGLVLTLFARPILHHVYGGRYDGYATAVALFALAYTATTVVQTLTVFLKTTGNIRAVPALWGISGLVTIPLAVPAMKLAGLNGAVALFAFSYIVAALLAWRRVRRVLRAQ